MAWLIAVLAVVGILAIGGRPDPHGQQQALDGSWRFHAGDDADWAAPRLDERGWDTIRLVSDPSIRDGDVGIPGYLDGWRARGHPALDGYGWYRRRVMLPRNRDLVLVGPPAVDDGYEVFWNGRFVGGVGRLSTTPNVNSTRPLLIRLPVTPGGGTADLAIRAFMQPGIGRDPTSGGLRTVPVLASSGAGARLVQAQWRRTVAGYILDAVEPAAMLVLAMIAAFTFTRSSLMFPSWMCVALVASACLRLGNPIAAWSDLLSIPTQTRLAGVVFAPLTFLAWTIAWNHWTEGQDRSVVSLLALAAWFMLVLGALGDHRLSTQFGHAVFALALAMSAVRTARYGPNRTLVLMAMSLTAVTMFASDLSSFGITSIWFPFNIGVSRSQYAYALSIPLYASILSRWGSDNNGVGATARNR